MDALCAIAPTSRSSPRSRGDVAMADAVERVVTPTGSATPSGARVIMASEGMTAGR